MADSPLSALKNLRPWQKWAVGIGGTGIAVYVWYRHKQDSSAATTTAANASNSTAAMVTDPASGQEYPATGVDPATGLTYETEITEYGSVAGADEAATGYASGTASYGYGQSLGGYYDGTVPASYSGTPTETANGYGTNAQWSQAVESGLSSIGYSSTDVATALGYYLAGRPLVTLADGVSTMDIVEAALAEYGSPPDGSYQLIPPPATAPASTGSTSTSTGSTGSTSTGSTSTGSTSTGSTSSAPAQAYTSGGHVVSVNNNDAVIAWTGHNAVRYTTLITGPGPINGHTGQTTIPQASFSGLEAGHNYQVMVTPYNSAGQEGVTGEIHFVTKR